ncbi:hypothetical protein XI05_01080 [Bradyrhizobium sp. CCBAU 11357]|nr:hypothetical protein [Bradyrhizobium sp. CCBAU 11357]
MNPFGCLEKPRLDGKPYVRNSFSAEFKAFRDGNKVGESDFPSVTISHTGSRSSYVIDDASTEQHRTLGAAAVASGLAGDQAE